MSDDLDEVSCLVSVGRRGGFSVRLTHSDAECRGWMNENTDDAAVGLVRSFVEWIHGEDETIHHC